MINKINHIGIAVNNLEKAEQLFSQILKHSKSHSEDVTDQGVKISFFKVGDILLELTEATNPDSPIAKYIEKRGEGIHHISVEVDNIDYELQRLKAEGFQLIDEKPRTGAGGYRIAFIHPKSVNGVLIELCEIHK